jgi:hypothetical protein
MIEQTPARAAICFLNFNGTAGLWRRACIKTPAAGKPTTITEYLGWGGGSYRAQMRGWGWGLHPGSGGPAEFPAQTRSF